MRIAERAQILGGMGGGERDDGIGFDLAAEIFRI
jgi:hypothetical protein